MNVVAIMTNARKKVEKFLDEVNRMLPLLRTVGLSVRDIDVEMGLLPSINVAIVGSLRAIDPAKIRHLRETHKDNRVLVNILRAVETAVNLKSVLGALAADTVEVRAKLGLLFGVSVRFVPTYEDASRHGDAPPRNDAFPPAMTPVTSV